MSICACLVPMRTMTSQPWSGIPSTSTASPTSADGPRRVIKMTIPMAIWMGWIHSSLEEQSQREEPIAGTTRLRTGGTH